MIVPCSYVPCSNVPCSYGSRPKTRRAFPAPTLILARALALSLAMTLAPTAFGSPWTPDDLVRAEGVGPMDLAADGSVAVWVKTSVGKRGEKVERLGQLWLADLSADGQAGEPIPLTHSQEQIGQIALSPDAAHVAFVTDRAIPGADSDEQGSQLWVLPLTLGGEARALTGGPRSISDFAWINTRSLLIARSEGPSLREQKLKEDGDTATAVDDVRDAPFVRLSTVDLDGKTKAMTWDRDWIAEMSVSPDGKSAVVSAAQSTRFDFDAKIPPLVFLIDLGSGERREILTDSGLMPRSFAWSNQADPRGFYFIDDFTHHPTYRQATVAHLYFYDLSSGQARRLEHGWSRGIGGGFQAVPGGVLALLADGTRYVPARVDLNTNPNTDLNTAVLKKLQGPADHLHHLDRWRVAGSGTRMLYVSSTAEQPPQLFTASLDADGWTAARRLGNLNESFANKPSGKTEVVSWTGALGETVEGILHYPFHWQPERKYPLILDIHGGPTGVDRDSWDATWSGPTPLWRQLGAFVLKVNYHGSGNYGLEWAESIRERYYELEIPDIELGVDMLIEKGLVDPDRLATTGWSNGGILSAALIVHTDRYKAAIVGAADVEWISDWGNVDFGAAFDNYYFGGPPWQRLDHYVEKSPFFQVEKITTPTLLHTGTEDRNVPPHQSWSMFRALQFVEKTDTRLLLYPGEPHGLKKIAHQKRKIEEDVAWIDRYLFGRETDLGAADGETATPLRDLIPSNSRLAASLALARAAKDAKDAKGRWGRLTNGVLAPEMIPFGSKIISRFEITVDQWREFEKDALPGLDGNLPAAGLTFEQAQAYARRLSKATGETYRLPTVEETAEWSTSSADDAPSSALTLDHWLGAEAGFDDRRAILQALSDSGSSLLATVDRTAGKADVQGSYAFGLDGNVSEWAVAKDGSGKATGSGADRNSSSSLDPDPAYIGLRLVQEP